MACTKLIPMNRIQNVIGANIHISTAHRWRTQGVLIGGTKVVLPAIRVGGRYYVEENDLQEFLNKTNPQNSTPVENRNVLPVKETQRDVDRVLDELGV